MNSFISRGYVLLPTVVATFLVGICKPVHASSIDVEFSDFAVGETFTNASLPRTINTNGVEIDLVAAGSSSSGRIIDVPRLGTPDNAMFLAARLRAEIVLQSPSTGGFFFFDDRGGDNLLIVNGDPIDFDMTSLSGFGSGPQFDTVGGVLVNSSPLTAGLRSVKLKGTINTLAFLGEELAIDSVKLSLVPEPSSLLMMGICCVVLPHIGRNRQVR